MERSSRFAQAEAARILLVALRPATHLRVSQAGLEQGHVGKTALWELPVQQLEFIGRQ